MGQDSWADLVRPMAISNSPIAGINMASVVNPYTEEITRNEARLCSMKKLVMAWNVANGNSKLAHRIACEGLRIPSET